MYIDTTKNGSVWGCDPMPYAHDAFLGLRAIIERHNGRVCGISYVVGRTSARGDMKTLDRLRRWWDKRGGVASRWMESNTEVNEVWTHSDAGAGNTAHVKASADYVYISLYHDTPATIPIAR